MNLDYQRDYRTTLPFILYEWYGFMDLERCPYASFSSNQEERDKAFEWNKKDDFRILLIALDRYADFLQKTNWRR